MTTYIALLRGINVGGQKIIKMEVLKKSFESLKFKNVGTYIQSGNVVFETAAANDKQLITKIEKGLKKSLGHDIAVILRTIDEFEDIVKSDPFKGKLDAKTKACVTFIGEKLKPIPKVPLFSPKKDFEVFLITNRELYSLRHEVDGRFGLPTPAMEKSFGTATTRNWSTVCKLFEFANE